MQEKCLICGAMLINSTDGIGCGCRKMLKECTYMHMKNNEDKSYYYKYWHVENSLYLDAFKSFTNNVKFRSKFKKEFSQSVITFYDKNNFVSKKQLDIIKDIMANDYRVYIIKEELKEQRQTIINEYKRKYIDDIIELTRKMWQKNK